MSNTKIELFGHTFKNPIVAASGTFGFGHEFSDLFDLNILGSISLKGTTLNPRYGNPLPRIAECSSGLINAIGLQNPGIHKVLEEEIPLLDKVYNDKVILNVGGHSTEEYLEVVRIANSSDKIVAIELNISCPNVSSGGLNFGQDPDTAKELVKKVKNICAKPLIVKLSPNVKDIVEMAKAVEEGGADAISLINTLIGMRIDLKTRKPIISVKKGGYSGPALFPVALNMVYQVYENVKIPIIGMGGITNAYEVIEMMFAGASLCMIGAANLVNPYAMRDIIEDLPRVMKELKITDLSNIVGVAHC